MLGGLPLTVSSVDLPKIALFALEHRASVTLEQYSCGSGKPHLPSLPVVHEGWATSSLPDMFRLPFLGFVRACSAASLGPPTSTSCDASLPLFGWPKTKLVLLRSVGQLARSTNAGRTMCDLHAGSAPVKQQSFRLEENAFRKHIGAELVARGKKSSSMHQRASACIGMQRNTPVCNAMQQYVMA